MLQTPQLVSIFQAATKHAQAAPADAGQGLDALLLGADDDTDMPDTGLRELLLQLSPAMLERFNALLGSGKSLPEAAMSLRNELSRAGFGGEFADVLQTLAEGVRAQTTAGATEKIDALTDESASPAAVETGVFGPTLGTLSTSASATSALTALPPQLANSLLSMTVPQRVGGNAWPDAIADRVSWMVQGDQQFARLKLNPPNLGPLEVRVSVVHDQTNVTFLAQNAAVRDALEAAMPRLREMFDQTSLDLVRTDVSDPGAQQGHGAGDQTDTSVAYSGAGDSDDPGEASPDRQEIGASGQLAGEGLIDLFA